MTDVSATLHHRALREGGGQGQVARATHVAGDLPRVDVDYALGLTGPDAEALSCDPAQVLAAMADTASSLAALRAAGLSRIKAGKPHCATFPATPANIAAAEDVVRAICSAPGAVSHEVAGRREIIAPFRNGPALLLASPYLGYAYDGDRNAEAPRSVFVGLFGSTVAADQDLPDFGHALRLMASERPTIPGDHRDAPLAMEGFDEAGWHAFATALAITAPATRAMIAKGAPLKAIVSARTSHRDCAISYVATEEYDDRRQDWSVDVNDAHGALLNHLEAEPLLAGHRSEPTIKVEGFPIVTRAGSFAVRGHALMTRILEDSDSATLRAAAKAALLSPARLADARRTVLETAGRIAPHLIEAILEEMPAA